MRCAVAEPLIRSQVPLTVVEMAITLYAANAGISRAHAEGMWYAGRMMAASMDIYLGMARAVFATHLPDVRPA